MATGIEIGAAVLGSAALAALVAGIVVKLKSRNQVKAYIRRVNSKLERCRTPLSRAKLLNSLIREQTKLYRKLARPYLNVEKVIAGRYVSLRIANPDQKLVWEQQAEALQKAIEKLFGQLGEPSLLDDRERELLLQARRVDREAAKLAADVARKREAEHDVLPRGSRARNAVLRVLRRAKVRADRAEEFARQLQAFVDDEIGKLPPEYQRAKRDAQLARNPTLVRLVRVVDPARFKAWSAGKSKEAIDEALQEV